MAPRLSRAQYRSTWAAALGREASEADALAPLHDAAIARPRFSSGSSVSRRRRSGYWALRILNIPEANYEQELGKGQDLARHVALEVLILILILVVFMIAVFLPTELVIGDSECP
jgi:hypothetical protein